jgi:membrane-bound serine protease (ClpP class)
LDGREVLVAGEARTLQLEGAEVRAIEMTPVTRLFNFLASPDVAVLLVMAGLLGIYIEFNQPGLILPGVVGAVCLVLAAIAFQILPFSWVGLLIMLLGLGLLVAEIFVTSYGVLFTAGLACFLLAGSMLFDVPEVGDLAVSFWTVLVPTVAGFAVFAGLVIFAVGRSLGRTQIAGVGELIGLVGRADTDLDPEGRVFVRGEYWHARADERVPAGTPVEVRAVEGMRLRVRRAATET